MSDDDENIFSMLDLSANGREYLLAIGKELSKDPEKEAFAVEIQDEVGVTYKMIIWLEEYPDLVLVDNDNDRKILN